MATPAKSPKTKSNKKLTRPSTLVTLYQGDYERRLAEKYMDYERHEMRERSTQRFGGSLAPQLAQEYDDLRAEAEETALRIVVQAVPRKQWRELLQAHPPVADADGEIDEEHKRLGFNPDTFFDAIVKPCVVEPEFTDEEWDEFEEDCSEAHWDKLSSAAYLLNVQGVDLPK